MTRMTLLILTLVVGGCSSVPDVKRSQIVGTPFENGGTSARTEGLVRETRLKGSSDGNLAEQLKASRTDDFSAVIAECKNRLERVSEQRKKSNRIALGLSLTGLFAGAVVGPTLVATGSSKGAIAFFSGLGGATNTAQNEFRDRGFDAEAFNQRLAEIHTAIGRRYEQFVSSTDDAGRQTAVLGLTKDCLIRD